MPNASVVRIEEFRARVAKKRVAGATAENGVIHIVLPEKVDHFHLTPDEAEFWLDGLSQLVVTAREQVEK